MLPRSTSIAVAVTVLAAAAPSAAHAAWTPPATLSDDDAANPSASAKGVLVGELSDSVSFAARAGAGFAPLARLTVPDEFERVYNARADANGAAVVITVRRHKPTQRVRATLVAADGTRTPVRTISDRTHSGTQPTLAVAPDGTAVAAWNWHDPKGWRIQAAIRKPGAARFGPPQNVSPASATRPFATVAAGEGGRAALTWQVGGSSQLPEAPLHVHTAGTDATFGGDQELAGAGARADVALAVGPEGAVQVAYLDRHFSPNEGPASLRVAQGTAGAPLSDPAVLSQGGKGTSSGKQLATAFNADGSVTVAWAKPGKDYEQGGTLEVFTRPAGGAFGAPQTLAEGAEGLTLDSGPGASAALAWMTYANRRHAVYAALRPATGGPFAAPEQISDPSRQALWPSIALDAGGDALAAWVTNDEGSGSGAPTAAIHNAG